MTRIRYVENNGVLTSKPLLAGTELVMVEIDTVGNQYSIKREIDGAVLSQGSAVDVNVLKKKLNWHSKLLELCLMTRSVVKERNNRVCVCSHY